MNQYKVSYTNWKGNEAVVYVFADDLAQAHEIVSVMQGLGECHSIEPVANLG